MTTFSGGSDAPLQPGAKAVEVLAAYNYDSSSPHVGEVRYWRDGPRDETRAAYRRDAESSLLLAYAADEGLAALRTDRDYWHEVAQGLGIKAYDLSARVRTLEEQRDRLREALAQISNSDQVPLYTSVFALQAMARQALQATEPKT